MFFFFLFLLLDDVLGIASSATVDSNNSNETGGSPCSITSGVSPIQSPTLNCSNNINNSNESTSADYLDKKKQTDISVTKVTVSFNFFIYFFFQ